MLRLRCPFVLSCALFLFGIAVSDRDCHAQVLDVWLGTGRAPASKGIYHTTLDTKTGRLTASRLAAEISGPGFLAMHPEGHHLYAVGTLDGKPSVVAYRIVSRTPNGSESGRSRTAPQLVLDNAIETGDGGAAHVAVDPTGSTVLTAQYGGGSVAAYRLKQDGSLDRQTQLIEHQGGSGVVDRRQDAPHPHWVGFSPDNRFVFVPDLGLDRVVIYRFDVKSSKLTPHGEASLAPGAGPRHLKFHPNGKWVYVLNELALTVTVFDYDAAAGSMSPKQTIETVSKALLAKELFKSCSEIRVHPNGRFVYAANRGHDTITAFSVNPSDGRLSVIEVENVRGATPRNFNLDPSAKWLLAAGQDSYTLASFQVSPDSGELTYNRSIIQTPAPICVLFQHE